MILDKEEHRAILLELISVAHFPGKAARVVVELTEAIERARVEEDNVKNLAEQRAR
jgi:hypothetical protein